MTAEQKASPQKTAAKAAAKSGQAPKASGRKILVRQVRSQSGRDFITKNALAALGLGRIGKSRQFQVNPALSGIIRQVSHLVEVDEVK